MRGRPTTIRSRRIARDIRAQHLLEDGGQLPAGTRLKDGNFRTRDTVLLLVYFNSFRNQNSSLNESASSAQFRRISGGFALQAFRSRGGVERLKLSGSVGTQTAYGPASKRH